MRENLLRNKVALIQKNGLGLFYEDGNIKLYSNDKELTASAGFNLAVNVSGVWRDSSYGSWRIEEEGDNFVILKNTWEHLPLSCFWDLRIDKDGHILWSVDLKLEEGLEINERRAVVLTSPLYKTWINSYEEGEFPQILTWQDMCFKNLSSRLVGARFSKDNLLPSLALEFEENESGRTTPLIQNSSSQVDAHIIGAKITDSSGSRYYKEGIYTFFASKLYVFNDEEKFDRKIETSRQHFLQRSKRKNKIAKKDKIKVLLINMSWQNQDKYGVRAGSRWPHIKDASEGNYMPFPFFLAYATSLLKKNGIDASLIDFVADGIPQEEFLDNLYKIDFDILVTETSTPSFYYDMGLLERISNNLAVPIVLTGSHPEIYEPEFLTKSVFIDFVLFGEYEVTLLQLLNSIINGDKDLSSIDGLIWVDEENNIIKNKPRRPFDVDILPWPHRDDLAMERYWDLPGDIPHPSAQMITSRGCPFSCNFCLWPQVFFGGKTYRTRDVKDVVDEMEHLLREKGFKSIYFDDDTFNVDRNRTIRLCNEIINRGLNQYPWAAMARADLVDEEMLDLMKRAGLHALKYGVESASQELVDSCGKGLDLKKAERMIRYTQKLGIRVHLTFSFGFLGETKETIKETIDYALKAGPDSVQFSIATPFPGTRFFEELDKKGKILTKDWSLYDGHYNCVFQPEHMSPEYLEEAKAYAYRLWADHQRKKRGLRGDIKVLFSYCRQHGLVGAFKKAKDYFIYLLFKRKRFIGRL